MFQHVFVPLDGSTVAEAALPAALEIARRFGSEITLGTVVTPPLYVEDEWMVDASDIFNEVMGSARRDAEQYLLKQQAALSADGFTAHTAIREGAAVAELIVEMAAAQQADLIVMSTHGRSGLTRWVLGSVAESVLRRAATPVLLLHVRQPEARPAAGTA